MLLRREGQLAALRIVSDNHGLAVADLAFEKLPAEGGLDFLLDHPFQGAGAINRVVTRMHQVRARLVGKLQLNMPFRQPPAQAAKLDVDDLLEMLLAQG